MEFDPNFLMTVLLVVVVEHILVMLGLLIYFWWKSRYKIPVVILRFVGDKRRPMILIRYARRVGSQDGTGKLVIRKYKRQVRDFNAQYYYPAEKSPLGGLVLWEFKRGWLTPAVPEMTKKAEVPNEVKE